MCMAQISRNATYALKTTHEKQIISLKASHPSLSNEKHPEASGTGEAIQNVQYG